MKKILYFIIIIGTMWRPDHVARGNIILPLSAPIKQTGKHEVVIKRLAIINWCRENASADVKDVEIEKIVDDVMKRDNYLLLLSIISVESAFNKKVVSSKKAHGLMQVRYVVWDDELKKNFPNIKRSSDLHTIRNGIDAGEYVLTYYLQNSKNLERALHFYGGKDRKYVAKVISTYKELKGRMLTAGVDDKSIPIGWLAKNDIVIDW